jgi:hypothetical protein
LPQRIARINGEYDRQGIHRTGTEVDTKSARWLAHEVARCGLNPSSEPFVVSRVDPRSCYLLVGESALKGCPSLMADSPTPPERKGDSDSSEAKRRSV